MERVIENPERFIEDTLEKGKKVLGRCMHPVESTQEPTP